MHYCHFEGQMFLHTMLQRAQLFSIALQRRAPTRGTSCMWHTNRFCSSHHHTHRCFPETAAVCHHSAPTHPLYTVFTALLGIAIAIFWSIYLIFCKGNAHHALLPGDQQFQFISFKTCFHPATGWKAIYWEPLQAYILQNCWLAEEDTQFWLRKLKNFIP